MWEAAILLLRSLLSFAVVMLLGFVGWCGFSCRNKFRPCCFFVERAFERCSSEFNTLFFSTRTPLI